LSTLQMTIELLPGEHDESSFVDLAVSLRAALSEGPCQVEFARRQVPAEGKGSASLDFARLLVEAGSGGAVLRGVFAILQSRLGDRRLRSIKVTGPKGTIEIKGQSPATEQQLVAEWIQQQIEDGD